MTGAVNPAVAGLTPYQPGKPAEELARERGIERIVKLASNENPRAPGAAVRDAIAAASADLSRYPDGSGFRLKAALAEHLGVEANRITLGNGSSDILDLAARATLTPGARGLADAHGFMVYPLAITASGGTPVAVASADWGHDPDAFLDRAQADGGARIVYIANPNNPTGTWLGEAALTQLLDALPETTWVVLDEAYAEYVPAPDYPDGIALGARYPNLLATRTFSKIHGLAGLRIGYGVSSPAFAELLNRIRQPFNANSIALAAAEAALGDATFVAESRALNARGMARIEEGLAALSLEWIPSAGNFVSFDVGAQRSAAALYDKLLSAGVIVRPLANYGMANHLRVSVGLPEENERFLAALAAAIGSA